MRFFKAVINVLLAFGILSICLLIYKVYYNVIDQADRYFIIFFLVYIIVDILGWVFTDVDE